MSIKKFPLEKKAPIVATIAALFLALIKFWAWIFSGSVALLASAIDSLLDTLISIFNYFAIKFSLNKADKEHNYWHWKMEAIAATMEGAIIILSGLYILYTSIKKIIFPEEIAYINWTIFVMLISIIVTFFLVYFLNYVYKKTNNLVIKADSLHYKIDLVTNIVIIIVLAILYFFPSLSFIDWVIGFIIWIYIIREAYKLVKQGVDLLLDKVLGEHKKVEDILENFLKISKAESFHWLKTRAWWSKDKFVEFHFVMNPETTILEAHNLWDKMEEEIKKLDKNSIWHIVWHIDPYDDSWINDCY